jgi:hypothetical protein
LGLEHGQRGRAGGRWLLGCLLLKGIWAMTHTRGPHPGRSDADEARFRMLTITAIARFLLDHFPKT